jgi:hypothetical protein
VCAVEYPVRLYKFQSNSRLTASIAFAKAACNKTYLHQQIRLKFSVEFSKVLRLDIWSMALYGAETWRVRKVDQKELKTFEMWYWRRMEIRPIVCEGINITKSRVGEEYHTYTKIKSMKANWIGHNARELAIKTRY